MSVHISRRVGYSAAGVLGGTVAAAILWASAIAPAQEDEGRAPPPVTSIVAHENAEPVDRTSGAGRPCPADNAANFTHYWLGSEYAGLKWEDRVRTCEPPPRVISDAQGRAVHERPVRINDVVYVYGACPGPGACVPPLQVISAPGCERPHSLYDRYAGPPAAGGPATHDEVTIDDTKAAVFDSGERIELYTGDATVTVVGDDPDVVRSAAEDLIAAPTSARGRRQADERFPEPAVGIADEKWPASRRSIPC
jgi:hypothetical protein